MAKFNMHLCAAYMQQLIEQRYPVLTDRAKALDLQIKIGCAFACDESPSLDPADAMLPDALRLLADSLEHEHKLMRHDDIAHNMWD